MLSRGRGKTTPAGRHFTALYYTNAVLDDNSGMAELAKNEGRLFGTSRQPTHVGQIVGLRHGSPAE